MVFISSHAIHIPFINVHVVSKTICTCLRLTVNYAGSTCYSYKERMKEENNERMRKKKKVNSCYRL